MADQPQYEKDIEWHLIREGMPATKAGRVAHDIAVTLLDSVSFLKETTKPLTSKGYAWLQAGCPTPSAPSGSLGVVRSTQADSDVINDR